MKKRSYYIISFVITVLIVVLPYKSVEANVTLSCYHSNTDVIGRWTYSPLVSYMKMDSSGSFPLVSGIANGVTIWNNALGTALNLSANGTSAPIKVYGGTASDLLNLDEFTSRYPYANINNIYLNYMGITDPVTSYSPVQYNKPTTGYVSENIYVGAYVFILSFNGSNYTRTYNNYIKTISHELGHAMGWHGHPTNNYAGWVMHQGITEATMLSLSEAQHLGQIYPTSNWYVGY